MRVAKYLPNRNRNLLPHQRPALNWMLKQQNPALFMEMRLGKSLLAIEWCIRKKIKRILVICPKTAIVSWANELRLEKLKVTILDGPKTKKKAVFHTGDGWTVTNLDTVRNHPLHLAKWDCIIVDECQAMKNPKAKITKLLLKYYKDIKHKILLSGTPTPETITEAVTQLIFKDGECLGCKDYWHFRARYMKTAGFDWVLRPGIYDKLKALLHKTAYFLTQKGAGWDTKEDRRVINFTLNPVQELHINELMERFETTIKGKEYTTKYILPKTIWMSKIAGGYIGGQVLNNAKDEWLLNYFKRNKKKKFIVWFRFNEELRLIENLLQNINRSYFTLTGKAKLNERMETQRLFQLGLVDVLLIQVKLGKYSLDLSKADEAIYFSNSYSEEERIQSEKRMSHVNRKTVPVYIDLIYKDSIEEELLQMLKDKSFSFRFLWRKLKQIQEGKSDKS